jgi:hypothetical protein
LGTGNQKVARGKLRDWLLEHHLTSRVDAGPKILASLVEPYLLEIPTDPDLAERTFNCSLR